MAYGISEDSDVPKCKLQIGLEDNWSATKAYFNSSFEYLNNTDYAIDITDRLKALVGDLSNTKRIRIQFEPQGTDNTCRIEANADIFVHLSSN